MKVTRDGPFTHIEFKISRLKLPVKWFNVGYEDMQEQPAPQQNDLPCIQDLVIQDIENRKEVGKQRYGTVLQPYNGRSALWDAYFEALDLCQYLRQEIYEKENPREEDNDHYNPGYGYGV